MGKITAKGIEIRRLLAEGLSQRKIHKLVGGSRATISKHSQRLKNPKKTLLDRYDWKIIQECADAGETVKQLGKRFRFTPTTWAKAVRVGHVVNVAERTRIGMRNSPLEEVLVVHQKRFGGQNLKKRMIKCGILKDECAICGCPPEWHGQPLVLRLDHINGDNRDCRRNNLRLVCPNCDSQLPTFTGRNKVNKRKLLALVVQSEGDDSLKMSTVSVQV